MAAQERKGRGDGGDSGRGTPSAAPTPQIAQATSRSQAVTVEYDFGRALAVSVEGIRTANVRVQKAGGRQDEPTAWVQATVGSWSTTLHSRLHVESSINTSGEYALALRVESSIWDLGMTSAEITIALCARPGDATEHPGIRVAVPSGAIGVTLLGDTPVRRLDLATDHGPAHLSDVAVGDLRLAAHHGNITVHDVCASGAADITGHGAWMDIDDVRAARLTAASTDAIISLKDVDAAAVSATTTNARIGLGNVRADSLHVQTTAGDVVASNVRAAACDVKTDRGGAIEGGWGPAARLHMSTADARIAVQVHIDPDGPLDLALATKRAPVEVDLPPSFSGAFSLQTTGYYKTFVYTHPRVAASPVLHVAQPDKKVGVLDAGGIRHSLKATSEEAPVTVNFGSL
ncbi:hypothetical protein H4R18_003474 [Coemansia javaensis]|uniref:DUF4097 domain-containing protein n=1 Tax=Coemansia javaensis TaxID=2761396 RepID=A0A9W8HDM2_9FUNG|nr:hypothetical protein H4R18_003474 [Coemansia javaensis]